MHARPTAIVGAILLALGTLSCQKLEKAPGQLRTEAVKFLDAIPADYGSLVDVTSSSARPDIAQLWFQAADGGIVVVFVDFKKGRILDDVLRIPRR